jgi:hypothetical protein
VSEPSASEFELVIEKLKGHISLGIDELPTELWQGVDQFAMRSTNLLFLFGTRRKLPEVWKVLIIVSIYKKDDNTDCINYRAYDFTNYVHNYIQHPAVKVNSICRKIYWGSSTWILTQQVNY